VPSYWTLVQPTLDLKYLLTGTHVALDSLQPSSARFRAVTPQISDVNGLFGSTHLLLVQGPV